MKDFLSHISDFQIFLASKSPRRQKLLTELGIPFTSWILDDINESYPDSMDFREVASFLSSKKAEPYRSLVKDNQLVITADTIVCYNERILGKPENQDDALEMLGLLSGQRHLVITGVSIISNTKEIHFSSETEVVFADLSLEEIHYYIKNYNPYDKAGSYGIQEWIGLIGIKSINGSYFNVMGLPIQHLYQELKIFTNYTKKTIK